VTAATRTTPEYADYVQRLRASAPGLAAEVGPFHGVEEVLQWMQRRYGGRVAVDIVGQDEFHYDFLIELEPGGRWVSFGVT
jgi:NADPH:quinone reductase-like Zn-dependent oxidoreductase